MDTYTCIYTYTCTYTCMYTVAGVLRADHERVAAQGALIIIIIIITIITTTTMIITILSITMYSMPIVDW